MDADDVLWNAAGDFGVVPFAGLDNIPSHLRGDISRWIRRQAIPCPHSIGSPIVFRVMGRADASCPACASERRIAAQVETCARCGNRTDADARASAFTIAARMIVFASWCRLCWNGGRNDELG